MDESHDSSLLSSVEDFSPPPSPPPLTELTDVSSECTSSESDESDDQYGHEAFGVHPYMFEPLLEPGSVAAAAAAGEGTQTHPREGMPADQW